MSPGTTYEWETPDHIFKPLHEEFGFTLDACATPNNAKCPSYFSIADDGLEQPWDDEVVWMNPPYGRVIARWMREAYEAAAKFGSTVVCLIPARTDAAWWHDCAMKGEVRFIRGRIKFVGAKHNAPFPSAVVVFRSGEVG